MTQQAFPHAHGSSPAWTTYTYDWMGRPLTAVDQNNSNLGATNAVHNPAGQVLSFTVANSYRPTFSYNSLLQVTGVNSIQYNYSSTQNNGKIISQVDMVSDEQVNYTYDALNRLATAQTSPNSNVTQWGQSFTYDGFGNLTNVSVIAGSAPTYSATPNNGNQIACSDSNGNMYAMGNCSGPGVWYDVENRVISPNNNSPVVGSGGSTDTWYCYVIPGLEFLHFGPALDVPSGTTSSVVPTTTAAAQGFSPCRLAKYVKQ